MDQNWFWTYGMCLGNNQGNFQLHRFTRRENTAKCLRGATFLTHTVYIVILLWFIILVKMVFPVELKYV